MTIIEFVSYLNSLGIKIWLEGDQLNYRAPKGVMNPDLKNKLLGRKSEILAFLEEAQSATDSSFEPIPSIERSEELPLSFAQQRMWFLYQLESQSPFYNEGLQLRVEGVLNVEALQQSINEIIRRHEILRSTFLAVDGKPLQVISPNLAIAMPVLDLQGLEESEVQQIVTKEARQPFDLSNGPFATGYFTAAGSRVPRAGVDYAPYHHGWLVNGDIHQRVVQPLPSFYS